MRQYIVTAEVETASAGNADAGRQRAGLTTRILLGGMLAVSILTAALLAGGYFALAQHFEQTYRARAESIAAGFERSLDSRDDFDDRARNQRRFADAMLFAPEIRSIVLFEANASGFSGVASDRDGYPIERAAAEHFDALRDNRVIAVERGGPWGRMLRTVAPIRLANQQLGTLQIDISLNHLRGLQLDLLGSMLPVYLPLALLSAALLAVYVRRRIVGPVISIGRTVNEIADGRLEKRLAIDSDDEFGMLCENFNRMLAKLEQQRNTIIEAKHHFEHQALHDALTGLPNRSHLQQRFPQLLAACKRHQRRGALMLMDLDNFKWINDNLGHHIGDELLRVIAERLRQQLRREDFIARLGGDEFVVVLAEISGDIDQALHQIKCVVDAVLESIARPVSLDSNEMQVSASIGIVLYPGRDDDLQPILNSADSAMYKAKREGGSRGCFFDQKMQQLLLNRARVLGTMGEAIASDQLRIFYQPQFDAGGRVTGAEALVRWMHPQHGLMLPGEFIKAIENSSLIVELGQWVLDTVCAQYRELRRQFGGDDEFSISINVCTSQFNHSDFVEQLLATLEARGLPPRALVLEITENTLLHNTPDAREKIEAVRRRGVRVSIDDYGTGCSSLTCLKDLELDEIKLDCGLVQRIGASARDREMVSAIINLSRSLKLNLVAEGVETREQYEFLRAHDCHAFQGRHFQEPLPLSGLDSSP